MTLLTNFDEDPMATIELPFRVKTSFAKLFEDWEEMAAGDNPYASAYARDVLDRTRHATELKEPFEDWQILEEYKEEIRILLSHIFPQSLANNEIKAASLPFKPMFFNPTKRFKKILEGAGSKYTLQMRNFDPDLLYRYACIFLLNQKYNSQLNYKRPIYFDIPNAGTGNIHHYRAFFNADYSVIKPTDRSPQLSRDDIRILSDNFQDLALWKKIIPPNSFDFEGFGIVTLFDVTSDEALSAIKAQLLEKDSLHAKASIKKLEQDIRSWFDAPGLNLGFAAFDPASYRVSKFGHGAWHSILLGEQMECPVKECLCEDSIDQIFRERDHLIISDVLKEKDIPDPLVQRLVEHGINSVLIAPLEFNGEIIGILELTSKEPCAVNSVLAHKLDEITTLFAIALKRNIDEYTTKLDAIVQEQFTAIHPSVAWRFTQSAERILRARASGTSPEPEPIVLPDVMPLYGQFDIRGSSNARNLSIQKDMVEQLTRAEGVISKALSHVQLPIYKQLIFRIKSFKKALRKGIHAGDEIKILDFLKSEVYPVFRHLQTIHPDLHTAVESYTGALDAELQVVYKERKDYESTVTLINKRISEYLDRQQEIAQSMLPHYFEKYKTDGVEYNIYVGQALLQNKIYHPVYLHNLRLWQLIMKCGVVNMIDQMKPEMKIPMDITSLILIHDAPLSIRFRMDEKQFDVDGAYNVRYEILKKRIDKANIKGTSERLTQPGKIAIVYSQENEAAEYTRYLEYLQSVNLVGPEIEQLELEDLQGTTGLNALRVDVMPRSESLDQVLQDLAVQELPG